MQKCTNRFLYNLGVGKMKRIVFCFLCLALLFNLSACGDVAQNVEKDKIIAVEYSSVNEKAAEAYIKQGYKKVTYNSSSDVVLAVENGKADCGILDDFEMNTYLSAGRKIKEREICEYSVDYCIYFKKDNEELQEKFDKAIQSLKKDGTLEKIKKSNLTGKSFYKGEPNKTKKKLIMLCDPSFPCIIYMSDGNKVVGVDVDIAFAICDYLGYTVEIKTADFDDLFAMLQKGEGDFLISACQLTESREEYFLPSDTYFSLNYHVVEKA